jgi:hypothetical protein
MKEFKITQEEAQMILNYLVSCPYMQVRELVDILTSLKEIDDGVQPISVRKVKGKA